MTAHGWWTAVAAGLLAITPPVQAPQPTPSGLRGVDGLARAYDFIPKRLDQAIRAAARLRSGAVEVL